MTPVWLCWALWALPLTGPGAAMSGERILGGLLRQLHLSQVPVLDEGDVEALVTPAHVTAQYVALLRRSHGAHSRGKRFSQRFRGETCLLAAASQSLWGGPFWGGHRQGWDGGPWTARMAVSRPCPDLHAGQEQRRDPWAWDSALVLVVLPWTSHPTALSLVASVK